MMRKIQTQTTPFQYKLFNCDVLNIPSPHGRQSFFPYVKNVQELKAEYKQQQWDFSCVVFDQEVKSLLYIRGIEENGESGLHITETEHGLYKTLTGIT